jgi:hypothetical protein
MGSSMKGLLEERLNGEQLRELENWEGLLERGSGL